MSIHRITLQVTLDVIADDDKTAVTKAVDTVKERIGDDGTDHRDMWVTGIARSLDGEYLIFSREENQ
jgi:hypothetical protein